VLSIIKLSTACYSKCVSLITGLQLGADELSKLTKARAGNDAKLPKKNSPEKNDLRREDTLLPNQFLDITCK
jgi:hypothetical protein